MTLILQIPDEILETIKIPKKKIEKHLKKELAFLLYERELVSMGAARRLADITKLEFIEGLAERGVPRHYDEKELEEDMEYAKSCQ